MYVGLFFFPFFVCLSIMIIAELQRSWDFFGLIRVLYVQAARDEETRSSLDKIKQHLNRGSGHVLLEGYLLKRSETVSFLLVHVKYYRMVDM